MPLFLQRRHDNYSKVRQGVVPALLESGTQNYVCLPAGSGFAWTLFTPQATLFNAADKEITTHFFGPNPDENGTVRAAWQHSRDTGTV